MVLPLVDEDKPKCFLCYKGFDSIEEVQNHQKSSHKDFFDFHEQSSRREPAPGDVTVF
ncbi:MAG TPA: hypothetical protein VD731_05855 [Nitrosopumilaceae archaeon]|nr:hypothetical protein [Nitrosopumilaceae archaeon]